jgi:hypothetical protein
MASEVPEVEVELEGASEQLLIYWNADVTLGPPHTVVGRCSCAYIIVPADLVCSQTAAG